MNGIIITNAAVIWITFMTKTLWLHELFGSFHNSHLLLYHWLTSIILLARSWFIIRINRALIKIIIFLNHYFRKYFSLDRNIFPFVLAYKSIQKGIIWLWVHAIQPIVVGCTTKSIAIKVFLSFFHFDTIELIFNLHIDQLLLIFNI